jgi:hypothetical protein
MRDPNTPETAAKWAEQAVICGTEKHGRSNRRLADRRSISAAAGIVLRKSVSF